MNRIKRNFGIVTLEFIIGFFVFWLVIVAWLEISYISYVTSINDLAINQASQTAKKSDSGENYIDIYMGVLEEEGSVWNRLINTDNVIFSVRYVPGLTDLEAVTDKCLPDEPEEGEIQENYKSCGTQTDNAIAIYYMSYEFTGIFSQLFDNRLSPAREVIVVQEYERDEFKY